MPTPSQMEVWTNAIVRDCLLCCGGDTEAGLAAAELILSTQPVPTNKETKPSISAFFAYDIANRHAQGILNRTLKAAKGLTDNARKDLATTLKDSAADSGQAILEFIDKYRLQLAKLLTTTQLASLLEGAREVAAKVPVLEEDAEALGPTPQPTFPRQDGIHLVTIEEAAKQLGEKNVLTRVSFDALEAAARAKAFTVAGVDASDTLEKIRDVLAKNVKEGADYETFKSQVMAAVDEGTFLSDAHTETVFRTNVQGAFSDGQMVVLQNPLVRSGFPYSAYDSIHDDRVRAEHLSLDKHGIDGSNVYRTDDPVFQTFRPPWDYNCRCSWTVMTIRQAAEAGVKEAKEWLDTGVEPSPPQFVAMPPFEPPPGFQRALMDAPLSVRLSLQPMVTFSIKEGDKPEEETDIALLYGASEGAGPISMAVLDTAKEPSARKATRGKHGKGKSSRAKRRLFKRLRVKRKWAPAALATDVGGQWITIGGQPDSSTGEKHVGGFRVFIDPNGKILKGRLKGKNVKNVKAAFDKKKGNKNKAVPTKNPTQPTPPAPPTPTSPTKVTSPPTKQQYKDFESNKDAIHNWGVEHYSNWQSTMSPKDAKTISYYQKTSDINYYLRKGETAGSLTEKQAKNMTIQLDNLLSRASVPENVTVYRGMPGNLAVGWSVGGIIEDKGFVSTSLSKRQSSLYAMDTLNEKAVTIEIRIPKGANAAYLGVNKRSPDYEMLLPRNSKIRIVSKNGNNYVGELISK